MALFENRNTASKGRPKGSVNKTTKEIRNAFSLLIEDNMDQLKTDLKELEPKDRITLLLQVAKFVIPTLKAIEVAEDNKHMRSPEFRIEQIFNSNDTDLEDE